MSEPITPALTPEQWRESIVTEGQYAGREVFLVDGVLTVDCGQQHRFSSDVDGPYEATPHAIAALALHEQPFGFTRADVGYLEATLEDPFTDNARSLIARIAALLPPDVGTTPLPVVSTTRSVAGIQTLASRGAAGSRDAIGGVSFNLKDDAARESFGAAYRGFLEDRPLHFSGNFPNIPNGWYRVLSVNMYESSGGALRTGDVTFTPTQAPGS